MGAVPVNVIIFNIVCFFRMKKCHFIRVFCKLGYVLFYWSVTNVNFTTKRGEIDGYPVWIVWSYSEKSSVFNDIGIYRVLKAVRETGDVKKLVLTFRRKINFIIAPRLWRICSRAAGRNNYN